MSATETIRYFSTNQAIFGSPDLEERISNGSLPTVELAEAIVAGQAPDGGLFMPTRIPKIDSETISRMGDMSYADIFLESMKGFFDGVLSEQTLGRIADEAYTFKPFIESLSAHDHIVRLDEGPTSAFKDYAAQVLFRIVEALKVEQPDTKISPTQRLRDADLLSFVVATSGDTGGAMGLACHNRKNMLMYILHSADIPRHVSELQAKQMDTIGGNVYVIRVKTDFDGCARLASRLQSDTELGFMHINSANSVNIGRLLPQIAYYFHAYSKKAKNWEEAYFSVPSGNFGNAVAGLFAMRMGLPIRLIVGVNENDVFYRFYHTGLYEPAPETHPSPSNSMNVNKPSNMRRLIQLYDGQLVDGRVTVMPNMRQLREEISAYRISDEETDRLIQQFYDEFHTIGLLHSTLEPHGAVAWDSSQKFRQETGYGGKIFTLETAHPGKFPERIKAMGIEPDLPKDLARLVGVPHGRFIVLDDDYEILKQHVVEIYRQNSRFATTK